jgi:hypothetical protein
MEARVAVLEEIAKSTKETLVGIRSDLAGLRGDIGRLEARMGDFQGSLEGRMGDVQGSIEELHGKVSQLPTTGVMITGIIGGQLALAGPFLAALRLSGKN